MKYFYTECISVPHHTAIIVHAVDCGVIAQSCSLILGRAETKLPWWEQSDGAEAQRYFMCYLCNIL